jgi:hypothetical protein
MGGCPRPFRGHLLVMAFYMKKQTVQTQHDEPVGIVISRGREPETTPRFSAYVWAPGPEDELETEVQAA